ncbi:MAG TPA: class IV adenylate cyclase [Candidatus Bathyarchaeota archaeon]|nr:class IV adenylate cyclase [Candidatus Bathyarchaeota archaeon]
MVKMEIEVKLKVERFDWIRKIMREIGAERKGEVEHEDIYYQHPCRDFKKTGEALRMRKTKDGKFIFTYKEAVKKPKLKVRREVEVKVEDPFKMEKIIERLGFKRVTTIVKRREKWRYREATICLDEVKGLGKYVEIELMVEDLEAAEKKMRRILEKLKLDREKAITKSYLEIFLEKNQRKS